ncbi:helix-turn-helix domain-containing protein [Asanoa sp. WMMD1127]|uniref:helix-turn-helix transcriptional regulator n=1 Tax=Asanoa sp. WMMD1127 TaxID=3016107 RepID=UPI0024174849|nr:helix-turn-helix domain-containing protein [Asanoa sp. WMMD1127]MDG4825674.1 helix-turn-helix domain-containing protein [Asanoa sp. WMMD1127]
MSDRRPLGTPAEVAEYLRKPVRTLEQWRYVGTGPKFVKAGRDVRYRWSDVDAWLDQQTAAAA